MSISTGLFEVDEASASFLSTLAGGAARGAVVLLVACGVALALRRSSAAARHLVWAVALGALPVLPLLSIALPPMHLEVPALGGADGSPVVTTAVEVRRQEAPPPAERLRRPVAEAPGTGSSPASAPEEDASATAASVVTSSPPAETPATARAVPWTLLLSGAWLAGVAACLVPFLVGSIGLLRLGRRSRRADAALERELRSLAGAVGVRRRVRLLVCERACVPMTWGLLRPSMLVPADFPEWLPERRRAVLLHELAHVRRRDVATRVLAQLGLALHWFDPLAWIAYRRMMAESECACDDVVLGAGESPAGYASTLLAIARALGKCRSTLPRAAIAMARTSRLERRLHAVLDATRRRWAVSPRAGVVCLAVAAAAGAVLAATEIGHGRGDDSAAEEVTVALDGSGRFRSIQAAVDAAPEGATVRIGPGRYEEQVVVGKPLTIRGAGWDRTAITSAGDFDSALLLEYERRLRAAASDDERRGIQAEFMEEHAPRPTVDVAARGVHIEGLKVTLRGAVERGRVSDVPALRLRDTAARIEKCVVAGSPGHCIEISGRSEVEIRDCLVAGAWNCGVMVDMGGVGRVHIAGSDVRNCHHRGIQVRPGGDVAIEGCRISGSAWHGIRYDHCGPKITGNLVFDNERTGIYASGSTSALVEGNLFRGDGVTCWFRNRDVIRGNTFVGARGDVYVGKAQAVSVLGASRPEIVRNVFADSSIAIYIGDIGSDSPDAKSRAEVDARENIFSDVDRRVARYRGDDEQEIALPADAGNLDAGPGFADAAAGDFTLTADSIARARGIGAATHLSFESPWPVQPEELRVIAEREDREREAEQDAGRASAAELAKPWVEDVMQIRDRARRDAGVDRIRLALASGDPIEAHAGLIAFNSSIEASHDKEPFRELVLPLVASTAGEARVAAFYALHNTGHRPEDVDLVLAALGSNPDRELRRSATHLIVLFTGGEIADRAAGFVLALLGADDRDDRDDRREALRGLWGAHVTPEIERRLIELAAAGSPSRGDAIYFGLSTLKEKSRAVLEVLFQVTEDPDFNNSGRAIWGLSHGVPEEHHALVADFLVTLFEARGDARIRRDCLEMLARYASATHLEALERFAANDLLGEELRRLAEKAAERARSRGERRG